MRIRYDEQSDALYIRLREEEYYESDEIQEGLILDYDQKGKLIGVEILDASDYLKSEELSTVRFDVDKVLSD
jgi:uncharacterized protein YuzE